jgi:ADP-ribose pyrophosphatase YjhB (NUDIX family)
MARTGLEFATNDYDRDRYRRTFSIAEGIAGLTIDAEFTPDRPYLPDIGIVTPKTGVTVAAFDEQGRIAIVKRADNGRWSLPAGWAEVGTTPSANALRELREETGLEAEIDELVGVYDSTTFFPDYAYHFYSCLFRARVTGGDPTPSLETPDVRLVDPTAELPQPFSVMHNVMLHDGLRAWNTRRRDFV